jgi:outer membrane autotransporter protein
MMPMFGLFLGYSESPDGTGLQGRIAAAYEHGNADFSHMNILGSAAKVSENAGFDTMGAGFELGWGYGLGNGHVLTPFVGLNYVASTRESYDEGSDGGAVADPLSFDSFGASYTTGILGLRAEGPLSDVVSYRLGAGIEALLNYDEDSFKVSGDFGTASYDSALDPSDWMLSGAAGLSYMFDTNKAITLDGYVRQVQDGEAPYVAISAGLKMGF